MTKEEKKQVNTEKTEEKADNKEIDQLKKELDTEKKLAEERLSQIKYLHADFDNYRKQLDKEKGHIINLANECLVKELITILDDFDASIKSMDEKDKPGLILLQKKFSKILEKHGLCLIEALGKKFNPHFHEALCKQECDKEEDTILEEIQKGYSLNNKVIRASKVKVAKKKENNQEKINQIKK
jgi:molecular chaperone GrpE